VKADLNVILSNIYVGWHIHQIPENVTRLRQDISAAD
jgi:hypothetical protein